MHTWEASVIRRSMQKSPGITTHIHDHLGYALSIRVWDGRLGTKGVAHGHRESGQTPGKFSLLFPALWPLGGQDSQHKADLSVGGAQHEGHRLPLRPWPVEPKPKLPSLQPLLFLLQFFQGTLFSTYFTHMQHNLIN